MSPEEFVCAIKTEVFDAAVADTTDGLRVGPPGRRPHERGIQMHEWFVGLAERDRRLVIEVARNAAHGALFGFLSVLDGVRVIDDPPHGRLVLTSTDAAGKATVLNNPELVELHVELNDLVHPPSEPALE